MWIPGCTKRFVALEWTFDDSNFCQPPCETSNSNRTVAETFHVDLGKYAPSECDLHHFIQHADAAMHVIAV